MARPQGPEAHACRADGSRSSLQGRQRSAGMLCARAAPPCARLHTSGHPTLRHRCCPASQLPPPRLGYQEPGDHRQQARLRAELCALGGWVPAATIRTSSTLGDWVDVRPARGTRGLSCIWPFMLAGHTYVARNVWRAHPARLPLHALLTQPQTPPPRLLKPCRPVVRLPVLPHGASRQQHQRPALPAPPGRRGKPGGPQRECRPVSNGLQW